MKGHVNLQRRLDKLVAAVKGGDQIAILEARIDLLEQGVYCLLAAERDRITDDRRKSNKLDSSLASLQHSIQMGDYQRRLSQNESNNDTESESSQEEIHPQD